MNYLPLLIVGAIVGLFAGVLILAYVLVKDKKQAMGFDRKMTDGQLIKRLLAYVKPYKKSIAIVLGTMLFSIAYSVLSPVLISQIEKLIEGDFQMAELLIRVGVYVGVLVISLVCSYVQTVVLQKTGQKIVSQIRLDVFAKVESLSHAQLAQMPVGKLVTRVANDPNALSMMFTGMLATLVQNCFVIIGVFVAMMCVNYMLTLMVMCFVPFIVLFSVIFRKFSRWAYRQVKDGTTDVNTFLSENLYGMKIVQAFNCQDRKLQEFTEKNDALYRAERGEIFVFGIFRPLMYMLYICGVLCLFYLGSMGAISGKEFLGQVIDGATIVAFYMFISKFFNPIQSLAEQFHRLQSAMASAEKIFTLLDIPAEVVDLPDAVELTDVKGDVEFRHVWFAYNPGEWVLKDVSFHVQAGQTVALVGATGSGKSTILSLLCRNYDIQQGQILLDGVDIRQVKISSLRKCFGQMLQDVFLFAGTVRSNITLGDDFTDEQLNEACRYVNADRLIARLDGGYDEEVRERGNNFSAGERQLLSFARTVIHNPPVMILDEATANIDTETEVLIQDSLNRMMSVGTMLIVAHRLSTIQHADNIIVLSHGQIQEQGTHNDLLKQRGRYYRLYTLQYRRQQITQQAQQRQ